MKNKIFKTRSDTHRIVRRREHYTKKNGKWKVKKSFSIIEDAWEWIKKYKMNGYTPYKCPVCGCIHIGKSIQSN